MSLALKGPQGEALKHQIMTNNKRKSISGEALASEVQLLILLGSTKPNNTMKNKEFWKSVIQLAISVLTAALTAISTTSCMGHGPVFF